MAELTSKERLQPSLLDRLTDDQPGVQVESRASRVMTMAQLRQAVLRDLGWLLNTSSRVESDGVAGLPETLSSVMNYGVPDLCGTTASAVVEGELERSIRLAIERFEPRVLRDGLTIRLIRAGESRGPTSISLEITGEIWGQPLPEQLYIRTEIDLDTGECSIPEAGRG